MSLRIVPTAQQRVAAACDNQRAWLYRVGRLDRHGHLHDAYERDGILAVRTGSTGAVMLPTDAPPDLDTLDDALGWLRHHRSGTVLIWSGTPDADIDRWLLARGAQESTVPRWMSRPTDRPLPPAPTGPATLTTAHPDDLPVLLAATELPYFSPWQASASLRVATARRPSEVALTLAWVDGAIVGRGVSNIAESPIGTTVGIYDIGVTPAWQGWGIGRQLIHNMLTAADDIAADLVTLNATPAGETLYRAFDFDDDGVGQTWLLPADELHQPPDPDRMQFALAVAHGRPLEGLEAHAARLLPNGDTPLAMAARYDQLDTARALVRIGTVPDVAALWQLGLDAEAVGMMERHPGALDLRYGPNGVTPLHVAIWWDDLEFLALLLAHGANPAIRDRELDRDARGWALALDRTDALALLDGHDR